jgi:A/G-specific adenine glycosylase
MEFGSLHCTPKKPKCQSCPFAKSCIAFNQNKIERLPLKTSSIKIKKRFFNYLVIKDQCGHYLFEKRTAKGIWYNLYQFPLVESTKTLKSKHALVAHADFPKEIYLNNSEVKLWNTEPITHKLSHQNLAVSFWEIEAKDKLNNAHSKAVIKELAVPVVIQNFIEKFF